MAKVNSNTDFDVLVVGYDLANNPASINIHYKISTRDFFSKITYNSINDWVYIKELCTGKSFEQMLAIIIAFDSMRFISLGGENVIMPLHIKPPSVVIKEWTSIFRKMYGEWRYLNNIAYPSKDYPKLKAEAEDFDLRNNTDNYLALNKVLVANGGGKDSLYSFIALNNASVPYDIYQAYLPMGGDKKLQKQLLDKLVERVADEDAKLIEVDIEDNFTCLPEQALKEINPELRVTNIDFFVGHTANYVGLFPVILSGGYSEIRFNIEKTSDRVMMRWSHSEQDGNPLIEGLNHQYCKSKELRSKALKYFKALFPRSSFNGFSSTLQDLTDTDIYKKIAEYNPELIKFSHSCNIDKPWCRNCPKCCFSYLMMCAYLSKNLADETFNIASTEMDLFSDPANKENWDSLLDPNKVAWECVAPTDECIKALSLLETKNKILHGTVKIY